MKTSSLTEWLYQLALRFNYLGVFIISLVGSLSIVFPIPYTLIIYLLGSFLDPFLVAVSGGLGSAVGEFSGYMLGYYGRKMVKEDRKRKMEFMLKLFKRYGFIVIFIFALTPLPDDLLFIPLGILRYPFLNAFIPALLGKVLMCFILAYSGKLSIHLIEQFLGEESWIGIVATTVLLVVVIWLMMKIDWEEVFNKYVAKRTGENT